MKKGNREKVIKDEEVSEQGRKQCGKGVPGPTRGQNVHDIRG